MLPRLLLVATLATVFVVTVPARGHAQGRHGAPPPVATPLMHMADGHPDVQGFWGSDAYTQDLETGLRDEETHEIQGRGLVDTSKAISRIVDPADGKIPYQPSAADRRIHIPSFRRGESSKAEVKSLRDIRPQTFCPGRPPAPELVRRLSAPPTSTTGTGSTRPVRSTAMRYAWWSASGLPTRGR
jgi:hypothetical protein